MVTLYNVIDTRTGKFHSEVRVKQRMVRFFVPAEEEEPGGTLEERVSVLEEVLQEQVMAVREEENTLSDNS